MKRMTWQRSTCVRFGRPAGSLIVATCAVGLWSCFGREPQAYSRGDVFSVLVVTEAFGHIDMPRLQEILKMKDVDEVVVVRGAVSAEECLGAGVRRDGRAEMVCTLSSGYWEGAQLMVFAREAREPFLQVPLDSAYLSILGDGVDRKKVFALQNP